MLTIVSLLGSPIAPLVDGAGTRQRAPRAGRRRAIPPDGGWPRAYTTASGAALVDLSAAGRELGRPEARRPLRGGVLHAEGREGARARHRQGGIRYERGPGRAARELLGVQDYRVQLPHAPARSAPDRRGGDRRVGAARGARDRARPRAGQHRHEPDHPEERGGREGGSAADLLQQDAGRARQHRRRADLGADPAERPEVGGQHQLGSVRARSDQDLLPSQRRRLAEGGRRERAVGSRPARCRRASRSCPTTTTGKR